jgi:predicted carbohydrate-binding protein with CBM5 and CBM33 domain
MEYLVILETWVLFDTSQFFLNFIDVSAFSHYTILQLNFPFVI